MANAIIEGKQGESMDMSEQQEVMEAESKEPASMEEIVQNEEVASEE